MRPSRDILTARLPASGLRLSIERLPELPDRVRQVARWFGLDPHDLTGPSKRPLVVEARHTAMLLMRRDGLSLPAIGRAFGRDHTSALYGIRRAQELERAALAEEAV